MARDYARILTAIWRDPQFRALEEAPQRMLFLLVTQPDISAAGILALRLRRWADLSANSAVEPLVLALNKLEEMGFIMVDFDAEELLIQSFIQWDGGINNPKRRPVIIRAAGEVTSPAISQRLRLELQRSGIIATAPETPPDRPPDRPSDTHAASPADGLSSGLPEGLSEITSAEPSSDPFPLVDSLSARHAASDGVVVTYSSQDTTTHNPKKTTPPASAPAPPTTQALVAEWITTCRKRPPGNVIGHTAKVIHAMLAEGLDPTDIHAGLTLWSAKGLHPSVLPSVVNELMNSAPDTTPSRRTLDDKVAQWQSLKTGTGDGRILYAVPTGDTP